MLVTQAITATQMPTQKTESAKLRVHVPVDLYDEMSALAEKVTGATYSRVLRSAFERWLQAVEAVEYECSFYGGRSVVKPAGAPFPPRTADIRTGAPPGREEMETRQVSSRVDKMFRERVDNALFWRDEFISHVARDIIPEELERLSR